MYLNISYVLSGCTIAAFCEASDSRREVDRSPWCSARSFISTYGENPDSHGRQKVNVSWTLALLRPLKNTSR